MPQAAYLINSLGLSAYATRIAAVARRVSALVAPPGWLTHGSDNGNAHLCAGPRASD